MLPRRMRHRTLLLVPALALAAAGCGSSSDAKKTDDPLAVKLSEWKIAPSATTAQAGKVKITADNTGSQTHELVVVRTDKPAASLGSGKQVSEKGSVGEISDLKAGATAGKTFDLSPGHYALICNLPGHYTAGMRADLTVR
jgi:uncharacterized cupredoxin-like copper-binding protein